MGDYSRARVVIKSRTRTHRSVLLRYVASRYSLRVLRYLLRGDNTRVISIRPFFQGRASKGAQDTRLKILRHPFTPTKSVRACVRICHAVSSFVDRGFQVRAQIQSLHPDCMCTRMP